MISESVDPAVKQCSDWAENLAKMSLSKIVKVVMTTGSEWGLVWRGAGARSDTTPHKSRFNFSPNRTNLEYAHPPLP